MKFKLVLITSALIIKSILAVATNVTGNIYGHWTIAGSPYNVINNINIPIDSILVIDPGVEVVFNANYEFVINGRLLAQGLMNDSISFYATNTIPGFGGIRFENITATQDTSIFEFCKVYNARVGSAGATGTDNYGGAFFINNFSKVRIQHCHIHNNVTYGAGGGISCYSNSNPLILDNLFENNAAGVAGSTIAQGGGIHCALNSHAIVMRNHFTHNTAANGGSAMYTSGSNVYFIENLVDSNGRTPLHFNGIGNGLIKENTVIYNTASSSNGPAIRCLLTGNVVIDDNEIAYNQNNVAPTNGVSLGGGLAVINATSAFISNNNIHHNTIDRLTNSSILSGAGIYADIAGDSLVMVGNKIYNNAVLKFCQGGGVYITKGLLINNLIVNNGAYGNSPYGRGGGVYAADSVKIINNTIANNYAFEEGGGIYFYGGKMSQFKNNIIYGNAVRPSGSGKQLYCFNGTLSPLNNNFDIAFCDIEGGYSDIAHSYPTITGTIYQNNLDTIPLFVIPSAGTSDSTDATNSNFSLQAPSSLINFGDSSQAFFSTDILGNDRIFDSQIDLGAYEFQSIIGPQVTAFFNVSNACVNSNITINNTSINATNYNWQMMGASPSSNTQASPVISYSTPGTYQIQLIASNGTDSDTTIQSITIYSLPIVNAGVDVGICSGSSVTLNATTSGGNLTYNWSPSASLSAPTQSQTLASPAISTNYVITVNDGLCANNDTVTVTVWPLPSNPIITQVGNTLEATTGFAAYQWYENNVIISGETQSTLAPINDGNYTVDAIDTNGCISTSQAFAFVIQGIKASLNNEISIYPNPVTTILHIDFKNLIRDTQIEIKNIQGQIILDQKVDTKLNIVNIDQYSNGIYFIKINSNNEIYNYKLVKQ